MRKSVIALLVLYVLFVGVFLPTILYLHIKSKRAVSISIKREWNTEQAHRALQLVESSFLNDTFGNPNVTFACNDTLEEYIMRAQNGDPSKTYYVGYWALSKEGAVSIYIKKTNETEYSFVVSVNNEPITRIINITINNSVFYRSVFFYINSSILNISLGEANTTLNTTFSGITVRSRLTYFEGCLYNPLCGGGPYIEQTVVFDADMEVVLVFVMVTLAVS